MTKPTYQLDITRDSGMWAVIITGLPPHMFGALDIAHFADIEPDVREAIADLTQTEPDTFNLEWRVTIAGQDVTAEVMAAVAAEAALADAMAAREDARQTALRKLARTGLSQSAIGDILRLSHQRVHQLLRAS